MLYRLFTENKNYDQIKKLVGDLFDGFTIIKADGVWQGKSEHSLIIEIDNPRMNTNFTNIEDALLDVDFRINQLCYAIKKLNQQDKILVQRIESESKLV